MASLGIKGHQLTVENEVAIEEARASTIFGKRLLSTLWLRENKVTSEPSLTAMQR